MLPPAKPDLRKAARSDLGIVGHPDEFADRYSRRHRGLSAVNRSIDQVGANPDAGRASNDLMLDIMAHCTVRKAWFEYE